MVSYHPNSKRNSSWSKNSNSSMYCTLVTPNTLWSFRVITHWSRNWKSINNALTSTSICRTMKIAWSSSTNSRITTLHIISWSWTNNSTPRYVKSACYPFSCWVTRIKCKKSTIITICWATTSCWTKLPPNIWTLSRRCARQSVPRNPTKSPSCSRATHCSKTPTKWKCPRSRTNKAAC